MKVIILSSGKGTRMMPLTKDTPKPMLEINGEYLLENKINLCRNSGLNEITINVAYKKNVIINYIKTLDIDIHLVDEGDEPLGTAEGIRNIIKSFDDEQFIVINSDIWTDYNLKDLKCLKLEESLAHIVSKSLIQSCQQILSSARVRADDPIVRGYDARPGELLNNFSLCILLYALAANEELCHQAYKILKAI